VRSASAISWNATPHAQARRPAVTVSDDEVNQAFQMLHGEKFKIRVIVTPTQTPVSDLREVLLQQPDGLTIRFAQAALEHSSDSSAIRGGLLDPISPADPPTPPPSATQFVPPAGQVTPVLASDRGFVIALLEERIRRTVPSSRPNPPPSAPRFAPAASARPWTTWPAASWLRRT
jgi:hypothetical protein